MHTKGHISQIIGPVVDIHFDLSDAAQSQLPAIHEALAISRTDGRTLLVEVQQHIGEDTVRTVAMDSTDGLKRGMEAVCTGGPITMPVRVHSRFTVNLLSLKILLHLKMCCSPELRSLTFWSRISKVERSVFSVVPEWARLCLSRS